MGKEINLSRKTVTEDKDGNALITGKVSTEGAIVDAKDLTTKEYVDNAIAQASIGGEVDTSGFALKTELPTKTSQLTNDSGFMTSIPDEYVTSSEVQQMSEGFKSELDKKSDILNYSDHTLNGTETYNNLEKVINSESEAIYIINKPINLFEGTTCSVEVKFSDNTNLLLQGEVVSVVLYEKKANCIQITSETAGLMVMVIDKVRYTIKDGSVTPEHDDNVSTLIILHPNANNVISLTITKPTTFEINNNFFTDYQFVNDTEKENWNNKADKSDLFSGDYNDLTNKPCYDTRITERKTYTYTYSVSNMPENEFIKVSDDTYTIEEIKNFSNVTITFDYMDDTASETYNCPMLSESDYSLFFFPDQSGDKNTACICNGIVYILLEDTGNTSAGTYFRVQADSDCIIEFSFDYLLSGEIKVLDEKYLANKPGRIVYTPSSDGSGDMLSGEIFNTCLNRAGAFSHAEGLDTWALGDVSHAEGSSTKAMGSFSHAEGYFTEVMGSFSHAEGCYTIASGACQHVEGRGNIEDKNNKYLHIVGNGTDSDRSNAHTLDWNGNAWFAGKATVSVQPTDNNDLTTKLYVDQSISQVNNDLQNQINELFQNVSSGKELIASAITDKGVDASEEETFQSLSEKINQIPVGPPGSNIIGYVNENNDIYVSLTELESGTYTLKFEDYTGLLNEFDDIGTVEV